MWKSARILAVLFVLCCPRLSAAAELTLAWDPPADGLTAGYLVFIGTSPQSYSAHVNAGSTTSVTISGLSDGMTYYFVVRAYSPSGAWSAPSTEVQAIAPGSSGGTLQPAVALLSPQPNSIVAGTITFSAAVSNSVSAASVWFLVDGHSVGAEDASAPYQTSWNSVNTANGQRTIHAVARDAAGNTTISAPVTVTVANGTGDVIPPLVSVNAPATNATALGIVTISANATDNVGVASVQFTLNGVNLGAPDAVAPYAINWSTAGAVNGNHAVRAIARDGAGNVTTSDVRIVAVSGGTGSTAASVADAASCVTADPFLSMGGGTCVNGGWLPPGMQLSSTGATLGSTTAPPPPPPGALQVAAPSSCITPDPFVALGGGACVRGNWLPPGMFLPADVTTTPAAPAAPPPVWQSSPTGCLSVRPGIDWVCRAGNWLPPGMFLPAEASTTPAAPAAPPPVWQSSPTGCLSVRPGIDWVCRGGGWLPPDHPAAR